MQDLMAATGLEKGGLYRHFANKEELAAEAFRFALAQNNRKLRTDHLADIPGAADKFAPRRPVFTESAVGSRPADVRCSNTAIDADDGKSLSSRNSH